MTVTWEAEQYRVDVAASEIARLTEARGLQGGNTLDTALALCRIGASLAAGDSLATAREATASLDQLRATLEPIEPSERTTASPPLRPGVVVRASLARPGPRPDARGPETAWDHRLAARARRGRRAGRRADVAALRHLAGRHSGPAISGGQCRAPARLRRAPDDGRRPRRNALADCPLETSGEGEPWHLRGALLGLDVGLARLALRRTRFDRPDDQPTLNDSDRRTLMLDLPLTDALDFEQSTAETASRVAAERTRDRRVARSARSRRSTPWGSTAAAARRSPGRARTCPSRSRRC